MHLDAVARNARRGPPLDTDREVAQRLDELAAHAARNTQRKADLAAHDALTHAIHAAQTPAWWETVERHHLTELIRLARTPAAGTIEQRQTLLGLLDRGSRITFGLPAENLVTGNDRPPRRDSAPSPSIQRASTAVRMGETAHSRSL